MRAAEHLDQAVQYAVHALTPGVDRDWQVKAGTLDWTCWEAAEHAAHCSVAYAIQLASQAKTRYVPFVSRALQDTTPSDLLEFFGASGSLLSAVARAAKPGDRGFHPFGMADAEGSAGMGGVELVVHAGDVAAGLGLPFHPPSDVCAWLVARMFPDRQARLTSAGMADTDPWTTLRWATGRSAIPGLPAVPERWHWHCAPLSEES